MNIEEYQRFISDFYKARNWYQYDPFIRANFLAEEVGEVSRAIRTLEIGRDRPDEQEGLPEEKLSASCSLQSENEQLLERDSRSVPDKQDLDHTCCPTLVCDLCLPCQWCEY